MGSLLLLDGSPRGERSNSYKMLSRVAQGWARGGGGDAEALHLARHADFERAVAAFRMADTVMLGMPLYTDSMPALVKTYIEAVGSSASDSGPILGFLVQSGFAEALHSRPLERYLAKLAPRLGCRYAGTIVHGGGEALQQMPDEASKRLWERLRGLGESLAKDGCFDAQLLTAVAGTERFSPVAAALMSAACATPLAQFYWDGQLRRNRAMARRFARPYA